MLKVLKYFLVVLLIAAIGAYIYMAARLNERDRKDIVCNEISIVIQNDDECDFIRKEDIAEYITEKYGECAGRKISEIDCGELENILSGIDVFDREKSHLADPILLRHLKTLFRQSPASSVQQKLARLSLRYLHCKIHPVSFNDRSKRLRTSLHFFHIIFLSYCQPSVPYISTLSRLIKNVSS